MKKLLRYFTYLPVILLGIGGTVIVVDMWNITKSGRKKSALVKVKNKMGTGDQTLEVKNKVGPGEQGLEKPSPGN